MIMKDLAKEAMDEIIRKNKELGIEPIHVDEPYPDFVPTSQWGLILDEESKVGKKFDDGKPLWNTLPIKEVEQIVNVLTMGANKYGLDNWKIVPDSRNRYENAMMRHYSAWKQGEKIDPESGESHLAHLACNVLFLMWIDNNKEKYDRE